MEQEQYNKLYEVRKQYGGTFVTVFQDGTLIPWKPLTMGEYVQYSKDRDKGFIPISILEDEIFIKCVLDNTYIRQIKFLKAGTVHTVVANIWQYSGPTGADEFSQDIELTRHSFFTSNDRIFHELVNIISTAYPYKPEEIYSMDYQTFMFRLIQAEQKLLHLGIYINGPITIERQEEKEKKSKIGRIEQQIDAKKIWDDIQKEKEVETKVKEPTNKGKWWKVSPVLESPNKHNIDFKLESQEQAIYGSTGHERADSFIAKTQLVKDAQIIYKDLIEELSKRKKK